jgi:AraC-like DNA-binding protein
MHFHQGMEVGVVLSGSEELVFNEAVLTCTPGDAWLCSMWEPHGWRASSGGGTQIAVIFRPEFVGDDLALRIPWLSPFAVPASQRPRTTTSQMRQRLLTIARCMSHDVVGGQRGWLEVVRVGLQWLLIELVRDWRPPQRQERLGVREPSPNDLARIMPAVTLVQDDLSRVVRLSEAAATCSLSMSRFHAIFRMTMGISFARFCLRSRLALCAHRLLTTDRPIEAIADEAGFVDRSHLHRAFVKQYRCTPGQFRDQHRTPVPRRSRRS